MLIVCPNCATSYEVEPPALAPDGRSVRCARCQKVWFAAVPILVPALDALEDLDLVDNGPRVPTPDAPRPPFQEADILRDDFQEEVAEEQPQADAWDELPPEPEPPEENPGSEPEPPEENPTPAPACIDGIDLAGLGAEIEAESAHQAAEADLVLAEVTGETALDDASPLVPPMEPPQAGQELAVIEPERNPEDIKAFAARPARRPAPRKSRRSPMQNLSAVIVVLISVNAGLLAWRSDIVRLAPQTASVYAAIGMPVNLRGLAFENIKTSKEMQDGIAVLVVEGSIVNVTGKAVEVPRLRLAVRNDSKTEIYSWTTSPARSILGPAEALPFRSRLASAPEDGRDVLVRFFNRRDLVAGLR
jgi:predicted Zn finger-like uncharacterized protein